MDLETILFYVAGVCLAFVFFQTIFSKKIKTPIRLSLSAKVKSKADRKFAKLLNRFKTRYRRSPSKDELFRIVINASHITIRRRGGSGHWGRQKVRKYLLEKNGIVKNYKMR